MGATVAIEVKDGLALLRLDRSHGNAINGQLVDDLLVAADRLARDGAVRGALLAASGKLFCPGLDLQELIEYDRPALRDFLKRFTRCVRALYAWPKPLVARIHGPAVAGGCVLTLCADWRVLAEQAVLGLNEVRVGLPFPYGVAMILRESVPPQVLAEVALFGRNFRGAEALASGLAHEVCAAEELDERCRARLEELAGRPQAFATSKRHLRSPVLERIDTGEEARHDDFLDGWFSAEAQERLRAVVDGLRRRSSGG